MTNEASHASVAELRWRTRGGRASTAAVVRVDAATDDDEVAADVDVEGGDGDGVGGEAEEEP